MEFFENYFGTLGTIFFGVLFVAIGLPLVYRKIKRNNFYGFRLKYTLKDDDIWYDVNAMLGRHMVIQGIILEIIGIVSVFVAKGKVEQLVLFGFAFFLLISGVIFSLVKGIKLMNKMADDKGLG